MIRTIPAWTVAGVLAAMLIATIHALVGYMLDLRSWGTLGQRTDTWSDHVTDRSFVDGFGPDGYSG